MGKVFDVLRRYVEAGMLVSLTVNTDGGKSRVDGTIREVIEDVGLVLESAAGTHLIQAEQVETFEVRKANVSQEELASRPVTLPVFLRSPVPVETQVSQINPIITKALSNGEQQYTPSAHPLSNSPTIEKAPVTESLLDIPEYAFDQFGGVAALILPEPVFTVESMDKHTEQQLDRCAQIYNYAVKVKEISRVRSILPVVNGLANSTRSTALYALCGQLALKVDDKRKSHENFAICFRIDHKKLLASLGLAQLHIENREWESAARYLCCAAHLGEAIDDNLKRDILLNLGRCIAQSSKKEIQGLVAITEIEDKPELKRIALALMAIALQSQYPEAAKAAFANQLILAQSLASSSPVFGQITKLIDDIQDELKPQPLETKLGSSKKITSIVTWKGGESSSKKNQQPSDKTSKDSPIFLPIGSSAFAKAKRFELEGDFDSAKAAYLKEINKRGSRWQAAVKDLAALHNRLSEYKEALEALDNHRRDFSDTRPIDNLKSNVLLKAKRYKEAANLFAQMQNREIGQRKQELVRQQAYCLSMLGEFESALKILGRLKNEAPFDLLTDSLIEKIKLLRDHGIQTHTEAAVLSELMAFASGISTFAKSLMSQCDLRLVDDRSKVRKRFEEQDFRQLDDKLKGLHGRVPQQRSEIHLTLAVICEKSPDNAGDRSLINHLGYSLQHMGEAAINDNLHEDTARCFLAESLSLAADVEFGLSNLLITYLTVRPAPGELHAEGRLHIESVLKRFEKDSLGWSKFQKDFPYYSMLSTNVARRLSQELNRLKTIPNFISTLPELNKLQIEEHNRCRIESANLAELASRHLGPEMLIDVADKLKEYAQTARFGLDKQRLLSLAQITTEAARYWQENDYSERIAKYGRLANSLVALLSDIRLSPTKLSAERIIPIAKLIETQAEQNHQDYVNAAQPDFEVKNVLDDDYCTLKDERLIVKFEVYSKPGGAPVEGLELKILEEAGLKVEETGAALSLLREGERREVEVKLKPSASQIIDQTFTLRTRLQYRSPLGELVQSADYQIPIRLKLADSFTDVPNPYSKYSSGKEVEDQQMFFGRKELIKRIEDVVLRGTVGQCFVLYGQKRSGKSSVLKQLKRRISSPGFPVEVTLGILNINSAERSFVQICIDAIEDALVSQVKLPLQSWPSSNEIAEDPIRMFRQSLLETVKSLKQIGWDEPRIILLIDEFQYIYEYIIEGSVPKTFMRSWKALLQLNSFSAVVVGQDSMPKFQQAYANEFGSTVPDRITYLTNEEASYLAETPILLDDRTRYRGMALKRLLELTAGSPFYMQIMCDRLVRHLNTEKYPFVSEVDVNKVAHYLTADFDERLPLEKFDPLITAAGESVALAPRELYLKLLKTIANSSNKYRGANLNDLSNFPERDSLLKDLDDRDVVEFDAAKRVKIRIGLFAEWLRANPNC